MMDALQFANKMNHALSQPSFYHKLQGSLHPWLVLDWGSVPSAALLETGRVDCVGLIESLAPLLETLAPTPEKGWAQGAFAVAKTLLFPEDIALTPSQWNGCICALQALQVYLDSEDLPFDPMVDFAFCTQEELEKSDFSTEYETFLIVFRDEYIYELLRLSDVCTPWRTLGHITGVHHMAMCAARTIAQGQGPIDLGLMSAAAAGHDFGKFGCKPGESVPYLHYHYTHQWFSRHNLLQMGHIAANHSTWDLELENLSAESLSLVYADFRVKQYYENGREVACIYTLGDAFDVILSKLDNVDAAKTMRYRFVYAKLQDFEQYLRAFGFDGGNQEDVLLPKRHVALMTPAQTVSYFRYTTVDHNLRLMHQMTHQALFINTLETARGEKNWSRLRGQVNIFQEYHTYLTPPQKEQTMAFLYELLLCPDGDIRRRCASLLGRILALFVSGYKKERPKDAPPSQEAARPFVLWEQYLGRLVQPDHKLTPRQTSLIRYQAKTVTDSLLTHCAPGDFLPFAQILLAQFDVPDKTQGDTAFALLDAVRGLPMDKLAPGDLVPVIDFALYWMTQGEEAHQGAALELFLQLYPHLPPDQAQAIGAVVGNIDWRNQPALLFLQTKLCGQLGCALPLGHDLLDGNETVSIVFLDNLKAATPWILKVAGVDYLLDHAQRGSEAATLHIATHLSNLLKVSQHVVVRHMAGNALLSLIPKLTPPRRNEIAVELSKALESEQGETYVPLYLGQLSLHLPQRELDEVISQLESLLTSPTTHAVASSLTTIGTMLAQLSTSAHNTKARQARLSGLLLRGLSSQRRAVRQESLRILGEDLFGATNVSKEDKGELFPLLAKKILFLLSEHRDPTATHFFSTAALRHMYRFVVQYTIEHGTFTFHTPEKVVFFPGTFDPFTLSHRSIVEQIRNLGFGVYLAVDEFSWSKKAQPSLVRRQLISLSIADLFDVYIFPHDVPVNLATPSDLERLSQVFAPLPLYLAMGSDVVFNASSYLAQPTPHSVHHMNHIVFRRDDATPQYPSILGDVLSMQLPSHLETVSSSRIRDNIDLGRDISHLIDPAAQEFIEANSLYLREPEYKHLITPGEFVCTCWDRPTLMQKGFVYQSFPHAILDTPITVIHPRDNPQEIYGYLAYRRVRSNALFDVLGDLAQSNYIRRHTAGKVCFLLEMDVKPNPEEDVMTQWLCTETLHHAMGRDCAYAVWTQPNPKEEILALLHRQGFLPCQLDSPLLMVDMRGPTVLMQNMATALKEPFVSSPGVQSALAKAHRKIQSALTQLSPGQLVLSLNAEVIHHRLEMKITQRNQVPPVPTKPRVLGNLMCVPFGKFLRGNAIPNTVSKTIHTSKIFSPDLHTFTVAQFPGYSPLESQVRTIQSFRRGVILVDDLLDSGVRMGALSPLFAQENLDINLVLVGLLSGQGRDLMNSAQREVDCVYFVPNLQSWFVESTMYPFIGGDAVDKAIPSVAGLTPGVNAILPYAYPQAFKQYDKSAVLSFSKVCLENARDILRALEEDYRRRYARNLTLSHLGEAVILPLSPDKGHSLRYDPTQLASQCLEEDLQQLDRLKQAWE